MRRCGQLVAGLVIILGLCYGNQPEKLAVRLLGVRNLSGYRGVVFSHEVAEALDQALSATGTFRVSRPEAFLLVPVAHERLKGLVGQVPSPAVARGIVRKVDMKFQNHAWKAASVHLEVALAVREPSLLLVADAKGSGLAQAEGPAVKQAVAAAAETAGQKLVFCWRTKGLVLLPPIGNRVRVSLDTSSGIVVGARLAIFRRGEQLASGTVVEVDNGSSVMVLEEGQPNASIRSGDEVRVTYLPEVPAGRSVAAEKEREYRRAEEHFFLSLILAGIGVALVGE